MTKVGICIAETADIGGAEMVAYKLEDKLKANSIDADIIRVPYTSFPRPHVWEAGKRSTFAKIALAASAPVDVWLNFAETSLRELDRDLLVTLHWNTLYLRHPNVLAYFLSHDRSAYDLFAHTTKNLNSFGKVASAARSFSRRLVDMSVVARIRSGKIPLIAISRNVSRRLEKYWNVRPSRIIYPGGYDPEFYHASGDYVLYFGRLDWNLKRIGLVYGTARMLPQIPFVVAGGPLHWGVDPQILHPPRNVRLQPINGLCPMNRKVGIYAHASCVLYPTLDEDFGIVPVEAMSAGKPCIVCTDGGGVTETVIHGRTGLITPPTPQALAIAVRELHDHGESMKEACQERARLFSWERCLCELLSEIKERI
jgi:glycosyltransferase involved in cell wall biosynthesis